MPEPAQPDVVDVLTTDHHEVLDLIEQIKATTDPEVRRDLADTAPRPWPTTSPSTKSSRRR